MMSSPSPTSPPRPSLGEDHEEVSEAGYIHTVIRLRPIDASRGAQTEGVLVSLSPL